MKKLIRIDENGWARCGNCSHKLFKTKAGVNDRSDEYEVTKRDVYESLEYIGFQIKCHSCKEILEA